MFRDMTPTQARFRRIHYAIVAAMLAISLLGLWVTLNQWRSYWKAVGVTGYLRQYAIAADQYENKWRSLPAIEEWRIVARTSPGDSIPAPLFDPHVAPVRSEFWSSRRREPKSPIIVFSPGVSFPEGIRFIVIDGTRMSAIDTEGVGRPVATDGVFVLISDGRVERFEDIRASSGGE